MRLKSLLLIGSFACVCYGSFNLYLPSSEVKKLWGLDMKELYYVQEGVVNEYALNFVVPVWENISSLHFAWQAVKNVQVSYSIGFNYTNPTAILEPSLNISRTGKIPSKLPEIFRLSLICTGHLIAEVDLEIYFNFTTGRGKGREVKQLIFKRKKICKGESLIIPVPTNKKSSNFISIPGNPSLDNEPVLTFPSAPISPSPHADGDTEHESTSPVMYIMLGCAVGAAVVLIIIGAAIVFRRKKKIKRNRIIGSSFLGGTARVVDSSKQHPTLIRSHSPPSGNPSDKSTTSSYAIYTTLQPSKTFDKKDEYYTANGETEEYCCFLSTYNKSVSSSYSADFGSKTDERELVNIERSQICISNMELQGAFGLVLFGIYRRIDGVTEEVLIKTISERGAGFHATQLMKESSRFLGISHKNVASPIGISFGDLPYIIYSGKGLVNMKKFLQECGQPLDALTVCEIGLQISSGLEYLHRKNMVHRDIAARNCMVDEHLLVQISDSALAKDIFPSDYHCIGDNDNRPIKWLSPEAISRSEFSTASDIWSFGVLLWEVCTRGRQPYSEVDPFDQFMHLNSGYRLAPPPACPEKLYGFMAWCWAMSPGDRPSMTSLLRCLKDLRSHLNKFI
ncbi:tyrosine-protein kinase Dnt-like [Artemia franciscana]|uniref:Uncharacterized protein n=1 Tax=Artemia franciscana TaxID=6661 RepID=A0AA88IBJ3_ARTSF|nr:hypothetical protein QYM36_001675 [Artemia franciscana]